MAGTTNKVFLIGRLGKDAETKTVGDTTVTRFSVATERRFKRNEEWVSETDWHNVTLWRSGKLAEYLTKGALVSVEGRLQTRKWEKDGETRYSTEVVAETIGLLSSASGAPRDSDGSGGSSGLVSQPRSATGRSSAPMAEEITDDDCPF